MGIGVNRRTGLFILGAAALAPAIAAEDFTDGDPLGSMQWPTLHKEFIGEANWAFSDLVQVRGPNFADDAMNVPLMVDARKVVAAGNAIKKIRVVVDRNPVRHVLDFEPLKSLPVIAFRIRMEQASPVRAMVELENGQWLVGSTWVEAAGGGCTVPGLTRADGSWSRTLGQVQARFFSNVLEGSRRLRLRVMHPMDTGLVAGTPAFYIEDLTLKDAAGQAWWHLSLHEPVSENPLLTLEMPSSAPQQFQLSGRDNGGNVIEAEVGA